jgi:hypothetical protein
MTTPTPLWQVRGQTGSITECRLHHLATGGFEIRITRAGAILFGERYADEAEARRHAADYHDSLLEKGWRDAA